MKPLNKPIRNLAIEYIKPFVKFLIFKLDKEYPKRINDNGITIFPKYLVEFIIIEGISMFKIKTNNPDIDKTNIGWYRIYINLNDPNIVK